MPEFIILHDVDGFPVIVNVQEIQHIVKPCDGLHTAIKYIHNNSCLFVKETVDEIIDLMPGDYEIIGYGQYWNKRLNENKSSL